MEKKKQTSGIATSMSLEGLIRVDAHKAPEHPEKTAELSSINYYLNEYLNRQDFLLTEICAVLYKLNSDEMEKIGEDLPVTEPGDCLTDFLKRSQNRLHNNNNLINQILRKLQDTI